MIGKVDARFSPATVIEDLAALYGIEIVHSDDAAAVADDVSMAPLGSHGISISRRALIIGPQVDRLSVFFHELIHLIVQPPFARLGEVPEEWILFQLERVLSRHVLPPEEQPLVEKWQEETLLCLNSRKTLGEIPDYETTDWWHEGVALCKTLGLLNDHGPTYRPADWQAIDDNSLKRWWAKHGPEVIERQLAVENDAAVLFEDREEIVECELTHDGAGGTVQLWREHDPLTARLTLEGRPVQRPYLPLLTSDMAAGSRIRILRSNATGIVKVTLKSVQHKYWVDV